MMGENPRAAARKNAISGCWTVLLDRSEAIGMSSTRMYNSFGEQLPEAALTSLAFLTSDDCGPGLLSLEHTPVISR